MQNFEQDTLVDDTSLNGSGWDIDSIEHDSAASCEGFATYVAMASFHNPDLTTTTVEAFGFNLESRTTLESNCADNSGSPGQVAKAFWDLNDLSGEVSSSPGFGGDNLTWTRAAIVAGMDLFLDGTSNRRDRENDADGVNVRDYAYNATVTPTAWVSHNNLECQDTN